MTSLRQTRHTASHLLCPPSSPILYVSNFHPDARSPGSTKRRVRAMWQTRWRGGAAAGTPQGSVRRSSYIDELLPGAYSAHTARSLWWSRQLHIIVSICIYTCESCSPDIPQAIEVNEIWKPRRDTSRNKPFVSCTSLSVHHETDDETTRQRRQVR